jgi:preprotein translocase subunit SecE
LRRGECGSGTGVDDRGVDVDMQKIAEKIDQFREFMREVRAEMHKSAWPPRTELVQSTMVVIAFVIVLSVYIGMSDWGLLSTIRLLIGQ